MLPLLLSALLALTSESQWKPYSFGKVTPNQIAFSDGKISIGVSDSASPLVHLFSQKKKINHIRIVGKVTGDWKAIANESWDGGPDDALLRIGLIENGTKRLNAIERLAAPDWIKQIEADASNLGDGIGKIHTFLLMPDSSWVGKSRENPHSSIFRERIQAAPNSDGSFEMAVSLDSPVDTLGLWLLADGDDSQAKFAVTIEKIEVGP